MTQTVTQAVAQQDEGPAAMITRYRSVFAEVLPKHVEARTFVQLAVGALREPKLAAAARSNPGSLMVALTHCARLGHEPATEAFYLVPFGSTVTGIEGYKGVIERMFRAGGIASAHAAVVRQNDFYEYEEGMDHPLHRFKRFASEAERGPLVGVFAYARMLNGGFSQVIELGAEEVYKRRDMNSSNKRSDSPWKLWEAKMWLKCAAHDLEAWVPTSAEYRRQELRAMAEAQRIVTDDKPAASAPSAPTLDGEVVDQDWPAVASVGGDA